jgi:hypothetical protein
VSQEQLKLMIRSTMIDVISETVPPLLKGLNSKHLLTTKELTALTGWSSRTLQHMRDTRQIEFSQHGRKILYTRASVDTFIASCGVKPSNHSPS